MAYVVVVVAVILVAFGFWYSYQRKKKRRLALAGFAQQYGLHYSQDDPFGLVGYPFQLFSRGDGRGCENVLVGQFQGMPIREADFWYYDESTDSQGRTSKTYHYFSVVIADVAVDVPAVSLAKENLMTKLADHVGLRDIEFESEEFNRAFNVKAKDREFCFKLLDARMMQWLLTTDGKFGFETTGPWLLVYCKRVPPTGLIPLLGTAKAFGDHVPRLVRTEYPGQEVQRGAEA
jgi:Protein of unknown function (DUF3137)